MQTGFRLARHAVGLTGFALVAIIANPAAAQTTQWRGMWVDCFHVGFKSTSQIDTLVQRAVEGKYNVIVAEVMGYQDQGSSGHGAYWNSQIVPRATDIVGGIDPLGYLCQKANAAGIQVYAWLVTYRASGSWPPTGNTLLVNHPEYFMVPMAGIDSDPVVPVGDDCVLDPGSPDVQNYLISIVRELVTSYPIHGINWDYIRYTQYDAGYPARSSYANSSLKRFQRLYNRSDIPSSSDSQWNDFRRRTIDELVRRCRAEIANIRTNPNQPVALTADVFATGSAPTDFTASQAYKYYQNWKLWIESGWLDAVMPMNYKRDHCPDQYNMYRSWIDKTVLWKGSRHAYCGQGNYMNSFANSVTQMQYVFSKGAEGVCNYSYVGTRADETICDDSDPWSNDPAWYAHVGSTIYASAAVPPALPWRNPATATEGTLWGQVINFNTGLPVEDTSVTVYGKPAVKTDANGYYTITMIPAVAAGTSYGLTVSKSGMVTLSYPGVRVYAGELNRYDFSMNAPSPQIVLSTNGFTRILPTGQALPAEQFQVRAAAGRGFLNYTINENVSWLSVSPTSGISYGEDDPITIAYSTTGLIPGTYVGNISVIDVAANNSPQTLTVTLKIPKPCDFDYDSDVDQEDFAYMQSCLTGVGIAVTNPACSNASVDGDADVDEFDVQKFIACLSGPGVESNSSCLNP